MARFLRQIPDEERPKDEAPFSTADQNAKTDALERLIDPIAPDATTGPGGFQQRRQLFPGQLAMVRLTSIDELGGGKYWGWGIPIKTVKWGNDIINDLAKEDLGDPDGGWPVQVWYPPEMGSTGHNLKYSDAEDATSDDWDFLIGVVCAESAYGRPVIIAITNPSGPTLVQMTGDGTLFGSPTVQVKPVIPGVGIDPDATPWEVEIAQKHTIDEQFYVIRPVNMTKLGTGVIYTEMMQLPIPTEKYKVLTPIDDSLKWVYTNLRFPLD